MKQAEIQTTATVPFQMTQSQQTHYSYQFYIQKVQK